MKPAIIIAAIAIGAFRPVLLFRDFNPHIESGYQAMAHILVGLLLGAWYVMRDAQVQIWKTGSASTIYAPAHRQWLLNTFWILTAIEVICAAITIYRKFT